MFTLFLVLVIFVGVLLSVAVLLQAGSGGGLASMGGGQMDTNIVGGRQAATILTKGTWWLGGIFLFLALVLSVLSANQSIGQSDVQPQLQSTPTPQRPAALPFGNTPASTGTPAAGTTGQTAAPSGSGLPIGNTPSGSAAKPATAAPTPAPSTPAKKK